MSQKIEVIVLDRPEGMIVSAYLKMQAELLMILNDHGIQWDGPICTMKLDTWYQLCALPDDTSAALQTSTRVHLEFDIVEYNPDLEEDLAKLVSDYIESL